MRTSHTFHSQLFTCSYIVSHVNPGEVLELSVNQHGHTISAWAVEFLILCFTLGVAGYLNSGQPKLWPATPGAVRHSI